MGEKAMVLFSGGIDSTTCLALAIEKYGKENVIPLSVFYGQKHEKEVEAASLALSLDCQVIYYGAHMDDAAGNAYPDCSQAFYDSMNQAVWEGSGKALRIEAPFINQNKAQIVARGLELKAPYQFTWSCYEGKERPCGVCGTCIDRRKAFEANGIKDPALWE